MNLEQRQEALEGEMLAAKDTIWRLTTRVVHLEKEVKDLKIVLKYTAKGYVPRPAKAAEIARLKNKKKSASKTFKGASSDSIVPAGNRILQTSCETVKQEPVSEDESNDEYTSDDPTNISTGNSLQTINPGKRMYEQLLETSDSSAAEEKVEKKSQVSMKSHPTKIRKLPSIPVDGKSGPTRRGNKSRDPAWSNFTCDSDNPKKDSMVACKTCHKVFNWPKIERLRAHLATCNANFMTSTCNTSKQSEKTGESNSGNCLEESSIQEEPVINLDP